MRLLDDLLSLVDQNLKVEIIQQSLNNGLNHNEPQFKKIQQEVESKSLQHIQRVIEEHLSTIPRPIKKLYFYTTKENGVRYHNVIQEDNMTDEQITQIILDDNGQIEKKIMLQDNILYLNNVPIKKFKKIGKEFRITDILN